MTKRRRMGLGPVFIFTLALMGILFCWLTATPAVAGVAGSKHDFTDETTKLATEGTCSACHWPHYAADSRAIWRRGLAEEIGFFENTSNLPADQKYTWGSTLLCYDCHDNHGTVDDDPAAATYFDTAPHDVAFDYHIETTDYGNWDGTGGNQGVRETGYFEDYYGGQPSPLGHGGHYFRYNDPDGAGGGPEWNVALGDKLPCEDCHDPHESQNQVFIKTDLGGSTNLTGLTASDNTRSGTPGENGRAICATCHSYSNSPTNSVTYDAINPDHYTITDNIPKTPATTSGGVTITAHKSGSFTPCTDCHGHQFPDPEYGGCESCHAYPPTTATQDYLGGGGAHQRHLDALKADFVCELCHGPNPGSAVWHNEGDGVVVQTNVDIIGMADYWDPGADDAAASYNGGGVGRQALNGEDKDITLFWEPVTKAGGGTNAQACAVFACHGYPVGTSGDAGTLNWTDDMIVDETDGLPDAGDKLEVCEWCHDQDPASIDKEVTYAPNIMGDGTNWGAKINGHGLLAGSQYDKSAVGAGDGAAGAEKVCNVCHDATYAEGIGPDRTHFGVGTDARDEKRLHSVINDQNIGTTTGPNDTCNACHQYDSGTDSGTQVSNHGNSDAGGYTPAEPDFTRVCRQCHEVHGRNWNGTGRNLYMVGTWVDADGDGQADAGEEARVDSSASGPTTDITTADDAVVFTSRTGGDSFDEIDGAAPDDETDNDDDICGACHTYPGTGGGDHNGTANYNGDERGNDCANCHDHDFSDNPAYADAFMPSGCEGCHGNPPHAGKPPDGDPAPNVMGDGTNPSGVPTPTHGTPKPYDDGTYGFNVNGHGRDADTNDYSHGDVINKGCLDCHNIGDPPGTHLDGTLNGRISPDTRNTNSFHLKTDGTTFIVDPSNDYAVQVGFDNACWNRCHNGATSDMRHAKDSNPAPKAVQFESHQTAQQPTDTPPMFYDRNLRTLGVYDGRDGITNFNYAPCVSCHNPHGTDVISPRNDQNNKMCIYRWKKPAFLCSKCHT